MWNCFADWLSTAQLVVEIAVSSESIDRGKAAIYADAKIPEYWIVFPEAESAEIYRDPFPGGYLDRTKVLRGETLSSVAIPSIRFDLSEILPKR